jgi:hypothetical protein
MSTGFGEYFREAFHARPMGMFVAPNWIFLLGVGLASIMEPAFLILGAGLELGYLFLLATNPRFQRAVEGKKLLEAQKQWASRQQLQVSNLKGEDQTRYRLLEQRCRGILEQQKGLDTSEVDLRAQGEGLARLSWIYLRLLLTRQAIKKVLEDALGSDVDEMEERVKGLGEQVKNPALGEDVRKSLTGQMEILQQRMEKQKEARDKVTFMEAELTRIEEQVELIREQAAVSADPKGVSDRIDQVAADLSGRSQWLRDQQQVYGRVEDLLTEPPPPITVGGTQGKVTT